eukprot:EG_transcript_17813
MSSPDSDAAFLASLGLTAADLLLSPGDEPDSGAAGMGVVENPWAVLQTADLLSRDQICTILGIPNMVVRSPSGWTYSRYITSRYGASPEARHAHYAAHHPLLEFCAETGLFELWSREYVAGLAAYLKGQLEAYQPRGGPTPSTLTVLEVGAGSGQLVRHLREQLKAEPPVLCGGCTWEIAGVDVAPPCGSGVSKMDYRSALCTFHPVIVLCSWMPRGQDWTLHFRRCNSVEEYVLIGEIDDGCCGHPWCTWGVPRPQNPDGPNSAGIGQDDVAALTVDTAAPGHDGGGGLPPPPPYAADGFTRRRLDRLSDLQLSRTTLVPDGVSFSHTVTFTRDER